MRCRRPTRRWGGGRAGWGWSPGGGPWARPGWWRSCAAGCVRPPTGLRCGWASRRRWRGRRWRSAHSWPRLVTMGIGCWRAGGGAWSGARRGPFVAALGDDGDWLLADGGGDMLAARHRLFVRVLELLAGLAARAPLVLVLEDLHWADESSRELLAFLAVRLRAQPVLVVGTLREEELGPAAPRG